MFQIEETECAEGLWPLGVSELKEGPGDGVQTGRYSDREWRDEVELLSMNQTIEDLAGCVTRF